MKEKHISVVIPNYNNAETIGKCLESAFSSRYDNFEIVVVDDNSQDNSVEIIRRFPCKLIPLDKHAGTSRARNIGALNSSGDIIFFIDSDCLLQEDTLAIINRTLIATGPDTIVGGTYTKIPYDKDFFSTFQSLFVNYSETKNAEHSDYIAAHAMIIDYETFRNSTGFPEKFLPIIEDVEFTHRLRREGKRLITNPAIEVQHIFNFSFFSSLKNAVRKTRFWVIYSLKNRDSFSDSGSASVELKVNVALLFLSILLIMLYAASKLSLILYLIPFIFFMNLYSSRRFVKVLYEEKGLIFAILAFLYFSTLYALAVGTGTVIGIAGYFFKYKNTFSIQ
jgi:glycosyltransferase involved in cell wall biosynthesis